MIIREVLARLFGRIDGKPLPGTQVSIEELTERFVRVAVIPSGQGRTDLEEMRREALHAAKIALTKIRDAHPNSAEYREAMKALQRAKHEADEIPLMEAELGRMTATWERKVRADESTDEIEAQRGQVERMLANARRKLAILDDEAKEKLRLSAAALTERLKAERERLIVEAKAERDAAMAHLRETVAPAAARLLLADAAWLTSRQDIQPVTPEEAAALESPVRPDAELVVMHTIPAKGGTLRHGDRIRGDRFPPAEVRRMLSSGALVKAEDFTQLGRVRFVKPYQHWKVDDQVDAVQLQNSQKLYKDGVIEPLEQPAA